MRKLVDKIRWTRGDKLACINDYVWWCVLSMYGEIDGGVPPSMSMYIDIIGSAHFTPMGVYGNMCREYGNM